MPDRWSSSGRTSYVVLHVMMMRYCTFASNLDLALGALLFASSRSPHHFLDPLVSDPKGAPHPLSSVLEKCFPHHFLWPDPT
jgi:hypothetical protein